MIVIPDIAGDRWRPLVGCIAPSMRPHAIALYRSRAPSSLFSKKLVVWSPLSPGSNGPDSSSYSVFVRVECPVVLSKY